MEERQINAGDSSAASSNSKVIGDREPAIARRKVREAFLMATQRGIVVPRPTTLLDEECFRSLRTLCSFYFSRGTRPWSIGPLPGQREKIERRRKRSRAIFVEDLSESDRDKSAELSE